MMNKKFTTCVRCRQKAPITGASVLRRGMTLVEMLVAMTAALIMMALVAQIMAMFGRGLNGSRKQAEMYDKLRAATERLKQDLDGLTVEFSPPVAPERGIGYFEYVEGTGTDTKVTEEQSVGLFGQKTKPDIITPMVKKKVEELRENKKDAFDIGL